jgi:hypothetical protein
MAKSDSDSNGLRQDQPECPLGNPGGLGGHTLETSVYYRRYGVRRHTDRPSVTELPGLTSDPIYTADRRGGILIHFGPNCTPRRVINPSECVGPSGRWYRPRPGRVCITSEHPVTLKGVGSGAPGIATRSHPPCLSSSPRLHLRAPMQIAARRGRPHRAAFVFLPMGVILLSPSNRGRIVTKPHDCVSRAPTELSSDLCECFLVSRPGTDRELWPRRRLRRNGTWQEAGRSFPATLAWSGRVGATRPSVRRPAG